MRPLAKLTFVAALALLAGRPAGLDAQPATSRSAGGDRQGMRGAPAPAVAAAPTLVLLVRHAEKAGPTGDVPLSPAGVARAESLAAALADARVTAIVVTPTVRTRATARPLAAARGLTPEEVALGATVDAHAAAVAAAVRRHSGGVVLVVGHSNTVPAIVAALGGPRLPELCDGEYSNLFVLSLDAGGAGGDGGNAPPAATRLVRSRYGASDASGAGECRAMGPR